MTQEHYKKRSQDRKASRKHNFFAGMLAIGAVGFLYLNSQAMIAGTDPGAQIQTASLCDMTVTPVAVNETTEGVPHNPHLITGDLALDFQISLLENGVNRLKEIPGYTATFTKQELVADSLTPETTIQLKVRHEPFSVYMKWITGDKDRELLYIDGKNSGKMLVHPGGWKGNMLPTIKLDPTSSMAMAESRYPVTKAGLLELTQTLVQYRKEDRNNDAIAKCVVHANQKFNRRPCFCIITEYKSKKANETYRKTVLFIDKELNIPVCCKNYSWGEKEQSTEDSKTLVEAYAYTNVRLRPQMADADFDRSNQKYLFR